MRPYRCNLCEKSFTQRCSLESHCLKVHGVSHQYDYKQRRSKVKCAKLQFCSLSIIKGFLINNYCYYRCMFAKTVATQQTSPRFTMCTLKKTTHIALHYWSFMTNGISNSPTQIFPAYFFKSNRFLQGKFRPSGDCLLNLNKGWKIIRVIRCNAPCIFAISTDYINWLRNSWLQMQ